MDFDFNSILADNMIYLNNYATKFLLDGEDRKDLVSETILKALDKKEYFRQGSETNFRAWLITLMTNIFINNYRKSARYALDTYDNEQMALLTEQRKYSHSADSESIYQELSDTIVRSLSLVDYRVLMAHVNGYSYQQIAEIMELPLGTIKSKIFLAREKIVRNLKKGDYE